MMTYSGNRSKLARWRSNKAYSSSTSTRQCFRGPSKRCCSRSSRRHFTSHSASKKKLLRLLTQCSMGLSSISCGSWSRCKLALRGGQRATRFWILLLPSIFLLENRWTHLTRQFKWWKKLGRRSSSSNHQSVAKHKWSVSLALTTTKQLQKSVGHDLQAIWQ